jgi:hypothetical protein
MVMDTDDYILADDEYFREIRQGIVDVIYRKDIQTVFAVLRDIFIFSMAQCSAEARWDIAKNFKADAANLLTESNAMAEAVHNDPSLAGLPSNRQQVIHLVPNGGSRSGARTAH